MAKRSKSQPATAPSMDQDYQKQDDVRTVISYQALREKPDRHESALKTIRQASGLSGAAAEKPQTRKVKRTQPRSNGRG